MQIPTPTEAPQLGAVRSELTGVHAMVQVVARALRDYEQVDLGDEIATLRAAAARLSAANERLELLEQGIAAP